MSTPDTIQFLHFHPVRIFILDDSVGSWFPGGWGIEGRAADGDRYRLTCVVEANPEEADFGISTLNKLQPAADWILCDE